MKISDLLSGLSKEQGLNAHDKSRVLHQSISEDNSPDQDVMIPPLQQKIELLKKAVNVDNVYDEEDQSDETETENDKLNLTINVPKGQSDTKIELTINNIKKLAGISKAVIDNASDDNDILS